MNKKILQVKKPKQKHLSKDEIKGTFETAWKCFNGNKLTLAYDQFEKILYAYPSNSEALYGVGKIFIKWGKYREAKTCFKKALNNKKNNKKNKEQYVYEYGNACIKMKWYSEAISIWENYLVNKKKDINLLTKIADTYSLLGNFVMAKKYLFTAYNLNEKNVDVLYSLGDLYCKNGLLKDAIYYFQLALHIEPGNIDIVISMINCFLKQKKYKKKIKYYRKAFFINPVNNNALKIIENNIS